MLHNAMRQNMADLDVEGGKEEILPRPLVLESRLGLGRSRIALASEDFDVSFRTPYQTPPIQCV